MTAIKKLIDGNGNQYFPQTHTNAVIDDNGYSVESKMQAVQDVVNQAQMAIGAVPSDLTPTENSTNWVTSGGVYNAIGVVEDKVDAIAAEAINTEGLECSVYKSSGSGTTITIENTSENNYTIHCITKTGYTYVLIKLPTDLVVGRQYRITYTYSSTSSTTAQFVFANSSRSNVAGFSSFLANTQNQQVSTTFTHQSNYVYLMTFNNDISTGADIIINDFTISVPHSIAEIEDRISDIQDTFDEFVDETSAMSSKVDTLTADAIDASGLECSVVKTSGSGTTITIENTSENNYLIHCITKVGYTYVLLKLPSGLVAGKQYKINYTYSSTSSTTAQFVFANSSRSNVGGFSQFLANTQNRQVSVVFTHQSNYVYLMTFNNDISTGADITINDLTITVPHSITEIEDRISALEPTVTPSAYYNGMHVELGNDYGYVFTTTSTSIRCNEGMAMYGDYIVCAIVAAGVTYLNIYKKTNDVYGLVASFSDLSLSHANAMQFAPTLGSGQTFPLLYVAGCTDRKCYVVQISVTSETVDDVTTDTYSASIVQTISLPTTEIFATTQNINAQIGDDGYLYVYHLNHGCIRLRCPKVSEGATITMTEDDVYDYYEFHYPYATYVWQGGVIHKGMLFMPVGNTNKTKCLFVFDIYNHSLKALINLDAFMDSGEEPEDAEVYNGELYIAMYAGASATSSKAMKKIKFL